MKSDIYHLVTVDDGKSDSTAIIKVLSEMATGQLNCDLRLLNYHDEVPVSYGATIIAGEKDSVELVVHEHQALLMKYDNSTLIKSKHFHNDLGVHCYAAYVNVPKKTVILHNFAYAQIRAERREAVRVTVRGKLPVSFSFENVTIEGSMVTISGTGLSFNSDIAPTIDTDQLGLLNVTLDGTSLSVPGSFVRAIANGSDGHICIFRMKLDRISDSVIGRFIYQRQVEIIHELKDGLVIE